LHGFFKFYESSPGDLSRFLFRFGLVVERSGDYFTFKALKDAPRYSISGSTYLGAPASKTYEGEPWEVMEANNLVYDYNQGLVVPLSSVSQPVRLKNAGRYYVTDGLILPGSLTDEGLRVTEYSAHYRPRRFDFRYSEVKLV